ncbi:ABC superfamily ATP binding cassette transporter, ABC protein [Lactobacillus helveticus H10]|nr:ABC superfamily ATP binding cassette transporter, ABC protein [Lactobacillus helveticus H10]
MLLLFVVVLSMRIHIFKGGHTLSAGQTGNIIFFSSALANHNIPGMINRASTFIAFSLGLLVVGLFHKYVKGYYWRVFCLFPILAICLLAICLIVVFLPRSVPNYYIVPAIAFGLAIQNASFSKIEGMGYNNAFTTGNLKKSVVAWSAFFFGEDKSQHTAAVNYMLLVISFGIGAIVSAFLQKFLILKTIWIAVILLAIITWLL